MGHSTRTHRAIDMQQSLVLVGQGRHRWRGSHRTQRPERATRVKFDFFATEARHLKYLVRCRPKGLRVYMLPQLWTEQITKAARSKTRRVATVLGTDSRRHRAAATWPPFISATNPELPLRPINHRKPASLALPAFS